VAERRGQQDKNRQGQGEGQGDEHRNGEAGEQESDALRARLSKLSEALEAQRNAPHSSQGASGSGSGSSSGALGSALSLAFRVLSEFVAAVIVGAAIGLGIDHLAGTSPLFLVVFLLMGAAAGFWNVYRIGTKKPGSGSR
jgi:ATP synthase protein I